MSLADFIKQVKDTDTIVVNRPDRNGKFQPKKILGLDFKNQFEDGQTEQEIVTIINNIINNYFNGIEELPAPPGDGQIYYLQLNSDNSVSWELVSDLTEDRNIDGGFPEAQYLPSQNVNGGTP